MTEPRAWAIGELPTIGEAAICMGAFDGVHRGHLALVAATVGAAADLGVRAVALVFEPHPDEVVRPGVQVSRLAPLAENLRRLQEAEIEPVPLRFDDALRSLAPGQFLAEMAPGLRVRGLVMTPESAFGRDRAGTPAAMHELGQEAGFEVRVIERLATDEEPISSGRIRRLLAHGSVDEAATLLGHPPYLEGLVEADGRLTPAYRAAIPAAGTYRARLRGPTPALVQVDIGPDAKISLSGGELHGIVALEVLERV